MSGHTPGPWVVHSLPKAPFNLGHHVTTEHGLTVCSVTFQFVKAVDGKVVEAERIANARLIAAAPDLLAALEMVRDADNDCRDDGLPILPAIARGAIDGAIARATGEQV